MRSQISKNSDHSTDYDYLTFPRQSEKTDSCTSTIIESTLALPDGRNPGLPVPNPREKRMKRVRGPLVSVWTVFCMVIQDSKRKVTGKES